ncbi:MAG: metallophosphoesterase family protein [Deltaproteobacteria bacterium]|nr:metallophosphoesterase family protein [Deltaproteobacteria bacterium]
MRLMIFSDIHGNLESLQAVLRDAARRNVHRSICLGDLVGYGPFPNECIELVRSLKNCRCLAGNHDVAALWETSPYGMSSAAKKAILWTMEQLKDENKEYLKSLPDRLDLADMTFVHANPYNPRGWRYVMDRKYALRSFTATRCRNLFIGHSHRPLVITRKHFFSVNLQAVSGVAEFSVNDSKRRIINCGSVGQPRDDDPRSCYLIYDSRTCKMEFYRVSYDMGKTVKAVKNAGLPSVLGRRLLKGI